MQASDGLCLLTQLIGQMLSLLMVVHSGLTGLGWLLLLPLNFDLMLAQLGVSRAD